MGGRTPSLDELLDDAAGFGFCRRCKFLESGTPELCSACAQRRLEALAPPDQRCDICDRPYPADYACRNPVCAMGQRWFKRNHAVSMLSGRLHEAIKAYKYPPYRREWAYVFGRILLGYLEAHADALGQIDLIVATPAYTGEGAHRDWDHIQRILSVAADHDWLGAWPIDVSDPPAIVRTGASEPLVGQTYRERRTHAETVIGPLLHVTDPSRTTGKVVAVVDDVFTDGLTLREVARALRLQGQAREVVGITLARKGWDRPDDAV